MLPIILYIFPIDYLLYLIEILASLSGMKLDTPAGSLTGRNLMQILSRFNKASGNLKS